MRMRSPFAGPLKGLALVLVVALATLSCRGDRNSWADVREEANRRNAVAKEYLSEQRYTDAKLKFEEVLEEVDGSNSEARFGKVLSELLQFASIMRVVHQLAGDAAAADENEFLHSLIDDLLTDLKSRFDTIAFELRRLKADPQFRFVLKDPTPVYLTSTEVPDLDLQGEWDRGEVFLLDVGVQAILGVLNTAQAIDLEADYLGIYNRFVEMDVSPDLGGSGLEGVLFGVEQEVPKIQNLLAFILNENANFLGLDPATGADQLSQAGVHFGLAVDSLRKALFFASFDINQDENQDDDVIGFEGNLRGDLEPIDPDADLCTIRDSDDEALIERNTYRFSINIMAEADASADKGYVQTDSELESVPATGCLVGKIMNSLLPDDHPVNEDPEARINLIEDVLPVLDPILADPDVVGIPGLTGAIESFLGNAIELDPGAFFHGGLGPRGLLPAWDTPALLSAQGYGTAQAREDGALLWMELECVFDEDSDGIAKLRSSAYPEFATTYNDQPYRLFDRVYCRESEDRNNDGDPDNDVRLRRCDSDSGSEGDFCDIEHFPGHNPDAVTPAVEGPSSLNALVSSWGIGQIPNDGVDGRFPYIAFQSPSFNGVLYLDLYDIATQGGVSEAPDELLALDPSRGFEPATQGQINAYLAEVSTRLDSILGLLDN